MIARMPAASSLRTALAVLVCCSAFTAPARAQYQWPVNGAPLCNGAGDQHRLFQTSVGCGNMGLSYVTSLPGADSLVTRSIGPIPPNGDCPTYPERVEATGVTEVSAAEVLTGIIAIGMPGYCIEPSTAEVWLQGAGAASRIVVYNRYWWTGFARAVVDDGDFVRHHPRMAPSGAMNPDTALAVVWSDERTGVPQIRAQRVSWAGMRTWGPAGIVIAPTGAPQTEPEIARLPDGSLLVLWLDARSGGSDVYALRLLEDGSPAPGWPAGGLALEDRPEVATSARLASTGYSVSAAVWEETGARFGGGRSIVARRLLADGTPDPAWDPQGMVLSSSPTVEHLQDVSPIAAGFVAVWTDVRAASPANPTDLYAQWLDNSGAPMVGWPASGLAICTATGRQDAARVSTGWAFASEYAAFAWEDHRGADADVYAELRLKNGTLPDGNWVADGLPATSAAGDQTAPVVGVGNGGGCFVAWEDARDLATSGLDIYAQAFSREGDKLDVPPGFPHTLRLSPPRPNPMRNTTMFTLQSPRGGPMRVEVLDVAGRRVRVLASGEFQAGTREIAFDGRDDSGRELPPGVYRVCARVGDAASTRTVVRVQ